MVDMSSMNRWRPFFVFLSTKDADKSTTVCLISRLLLNKGDFLNSAMVSGNYNKIVEIELFESTEIGTK